MNAPRLFAIVGSIAIAVVLFIVLSPGDDSSDQTTDETIATTTTDSATGPNGQEPQPEPEPEPEVTRIVVEGGIPRDGVAEIEVDKGDDVRLVVKSDVADHVHVHGYDFFKDVPAGGRAKFDFPATIDGVFEIELEDRATLIAELTVQP